MKCRLSRRDPVHYDPVHYVGTGGFWGYDELAHAEGDSPDGQGWPYHMAWDFSFKWVVRCTAGRATGEILSTRERNYHTTGHLSGRPYSASIE